MSTDKKPCGCPFCGEPVAHEASACTPCGVRVSYCCACGQPLPQKAEKCPACGKEQPGREPR